MNNPTPNSRAQLWSALETGDLGTLLSALDQGVSPDSAHGKWTPLGKALRRGHVELAMALIDAGADVSKDDQSLALIEIAAGTPSLNGVLDRLIEKGARLTYESFLIAARSGNRGAVDSLARVGVYQEKETRQPMSAVCMWPVNHGDIPGPLVEATFTSSISDDECKKIIWACAREKNEALFSLLTERPEVPRRFHHVLLRACILSDWPEKVDYLLNTTLCKLEYVDPHDEPVLGAVASLLRLGTNKTQLWHRLDQLVDYGYHPSTFFMKFTHNAGQVMYSPYPVWLEMVKQGPPKGRRKLIQKLVEKGAQLGNRFGAIDQPVARGGLVHLLLSMGDIDTAVWAIKKWPKQTWEDHHSGGVVASWARYCKPEHASESLTRLLSLGLNLNLPDFEGASVLCNLLERADINRMMSKADRIHFDLLYPLVDQLIEAGVRFDCMFGKERDLDFARRIGVSPHKTTHWEAQSIQHMTPHVSRTASSRRL